MVILELHYERGDLAPGMVNGGLKKGDFLTTCMPNAGFWLPSSVNKSGESAVGTGISCPRWPGFAVRQDKPVRIKNSGGAGRDAGGAQAGGESVEKVVVVAEKQLLARESRSVVRLTLKELGRRAK